MISIHSEDIDVAIAEVMTRKASADVQLQMSLLKNLRVFVAITGSSGAGKSSFVNALRGLDDDEEHSAKTEVPTIEPTPYPCPLIPNFIIWDLPGTRTPNFEADKYLKQVSFDKYDFYILVGEEPLTENNIKLVHEIQKMKKRFYYVLTKVDATIDHEQRKMKKNFKEKEMLDKMKKDCEEELRKAGEPSPRVFLISRWELDKYDFPCLLKQMERDQEVIQKDALAMFLSGKEGLGQKMEAMEEHIWKHSIASSVTGLYYIPGLLLFYDIDILVVAMNHIWKVFGLDEESLNMLAMRVGKSVDELKSGIKTCPIVGEISSEMVIDYLKRSEVLGKKTMEELARDFQPTVRSQVDAANSFICTYLMLKNFIADVMRDAENVLEKAAEEKSLRIPDLTQNISSPNTEDIDGAISEAMRRQNIRPIKATVAGKDLQHVSAELQQELRLLKNVRADIAVTGVTGTGKSSLVNALRGLSDDDEHAATTGVQLTTTSTTPYPYLPFPNIILWDLPGVGTSEYKPDTYPEQVNFGKYDLFIIVGHNRIRENDIKLMHEIKKMKKKVYYAHNKMDLSIDNERRKKSFNEKEILDRIRKYCEKTLKEAGEPSPIVFLISRWKLDKYDFPHLIEQMRKDILEMFLPVSSKGDLRQKEVDMENYIWKQSFASCVKGRALIQGLSLACDIGILVAAMKHICKVFGLDKESLHTVAKRFGKSVDVLKSAIQNCPIADEIHTQMVTSLLKRSEVWKTRIMEEIALDFTPTLGSFFGQPQTFVCTFYMLNHFLKDVVRGAENILAKAAE